MNEQEMLLKFQSPLGGLLRERPVVVLEVHGAKGHEDVRVRARLQEADRLLPRLNNSIELNNSMNNSIHSIEQPYD